DRKVRELVAFIGVGGVAAAAHPGGELVGGIGDRGRPGNGGARAPVLKQRPGRAVIDPPFELIGRLAAAGGGGEGDGGAGRLRRNLVGGHGSEGRGRRRRDRKIRELVALVGVGGVAAAAHPGGELVGEIGRASCRGS